MSLDNSSSCVLHMLGMMVARSLEDNLLIFIISNGINERALGV